jgi:hypothetical protein
LPTSPVAVLILHEDGDGPNGTQQRSVVVLDGRDDDQLSDGCVRIGTLNDLDAGDWWDLDAAAAASSSAFSTTSLATA